MAQDFATRLRMLLAYRGWKQKDLAREIRAEPNTVNGWINGRKAPIGPVKYAIAKALGVDYDWLDTGAGISPWGGTEHREADTREPEFPRDRERPVTLEKVKQEEMKKKKKRDSA